MLRCGNGNSQIGKAIVVSSSGLWPFINACTAWRSWQCCRNNRKTGYACSGHMWQRCDLPGEKYVSIWMNFLLLRVAPCILSDWDNMPVSVRKVHTYKCDFWAFFGGGGVGRLAWSLKHVLRKCITLVIEGWLWSVVWWFWLSWSLMLRHPVVCLLFYSFLKKKWDTWHMLLSSFGVTSMLDNIMTEFDMGKDAKIFCNWGGDGLF